MTNKLNNTKVTLIPGGRIKDLADHMDATDKESLYSSIFLCVGTNDCSDKDTDMNAVTSSYKTMVTKLTSQVTKPADVVIGSVPPRSDSKDHQQRVDALNAALTTVASDTGATFVDHNVYFKMSTGEVNEDYLCSDRVHMSRQGTNRLIKNLNVPTKANHRNDVTKSSDVVKSPTSSPKNNGWMTQRGRDYGNQKQSSVRQNRNQQNYDHQHRQYNQQERGCHNCGERNHSVKNCKYDSKLRCHTCGKYGHKYRHCWTSLQH